MRISVLMNTFNRAHLLRFAMRSYLRQTEGEFELVVADDGSSDDTPAVVEEFKGLAPFEVTYVRQEHEGHRRAAILNRGIDACKHEWVLFTDCDSLAMPDLIAQHRAHADPSRLLCGGYVRLTQAETDPLTDDDVLSGRFEQLIGLGRRWEIWRKDMRARWEIFRRKPRRPHNMGLNYSVARDKLFEINGYDEEFRGWGGADGDVRERLRRVGVQPYSLYGSAIVLHMWHPTEKTKTKDVVKRNRELARREVPVFCSRGLRPAPAEAVHDEARG